MPKVSTKSLSSIRATAVDAAIKAGAVLRSHFGKKLKVEEKKNAGIVTNVDREAEKKAVRALRKGVPSFGIIAEESGTSGAESGRWIIDPLDGTTNFVHGFPMFCVSIAAEVDGVVQVGVIYHPILKDLYVAVRGKGATLNGKRLRVSRASRIEDAVFSTGFAYLHAEELRHEIAVFGRIAARARAIRRPGSAALDLAYTARGVFDGFWERGLSVWDIAAGSLLVEEAGGRVTDFQGQPIDISRQLSLPPAEREILAASPAIYPSLRGAIVDTNP